jgi:hypothetical protein
MPGHESAASLYAFLAAVRSGKSAVPPHSVEVVKRVLDCCEKRDQRR